MKKRNLNFNPGKLTFIAAFAVVCFLTSCEKDVTDLNSASNMDQLTEKSANITEPGVPQQLVSGLLGSSGSAVGPGGALYVTEGAVGKISRINPKTGDVSTFASGFPPSLIGIGGVWDVAFIGGTAYALVTLVDDPNLFPTGEVNGIYRVDGPNSFTIIADIGAYNLANPPTGFNYFVNTGMLYSIQNYRGGFLVADGHLNRILFVTTKGEISELKTFGNIVPTGLAVSGNTIYMSVTGPVPHEPEDGKLLSFGSNSPTVTTVASGAPLLVDVEFNRGRTLFALSQGKWDGLAEGSPAIPNDGTLVRVNDDGTFTTVADGLDRPTSLEFINNTAYVVTLSGEVWTVENAAGPPFGSE
jgi:hypothetical protein